MFIRELETEITKTLDDGSSRKRPKSFFSHRNLKFYCVESVQIRSFFCPLFTRVLLKYGSVKKRRTPYPESFYPIFMRRKHHILQSVSKNIAFFVLRKWILHSYFFFSVRFYCLFTSVLKILLLLFSTFRITVIINSFNSLVPGVY